MHCVKNNLLFAGNLEIATQLREYGCSCVQPVLDYFQAKFSQDLESAKAFNAARLFVPQKVNDMKPDANTINSLAAFPFFTSSTL